METGAKPLGYLKDLYTFVAALALETAVAEVISVEGSGATIHWGFLPLFVAFTVTLVPFYHGALRHLDITYASKDDGETRAGLMLLDFSVLFVEAGMLFSLAKLISVPRYFGWALLLVLLIDISWSCAINLLSHRPFLSLDESEWAKINAAASLLVFGVMLVYTVAGLSRGLQVLLFGLGVARTLVDYWISWTYYFPQAKRATE